MQSYRRDFRLDRFMILLVVGLMAFSLVVIAYASRAVAPPTDPRYFVTRQAIWIVCGLLVLTVTTAVDYRRLKRWAPLIYWLSVGLLVVVLVRGHTVLGAQRWIQIGSVQVQPSEFATVALIVSLATHLDRQPGRNRWRDLGSALLHVGLPMLLILKQPDLGTALVVVAITVGMLYMAGVPWTQMLLFPAGLAAIIGWIYAHYQWSVPLPLLHPYQLDRLLIFLHPDASPYSVGFNVLQSRVTVGAGGVFGAGLGPNPSNLLGFLPEAHTDFVFAAVAELFGFVGVAVVLGVYIVLLGWGMAVATRAPDRFGLLLASGVVALLAFPVLESAGMVTGIMPVAGIPMPFISYGGSALVTDAAAVGLLLNVARRSRASTALLSIRDRLLRGSAPHADR
ncbi:MAG: rod shape-determining protein RodA [Sulfobacillus acidophilus]|uniref:Rod shape-determining protein RodA n=1 Tax=Sulfobacillus acidophilus TaxID=53633 RepID=A0A2T2WFL6_9FIRM|nr:MAG: rod shape-determining protein RodA [Sulfobacillus acidophilus]